MIAPPAETTLSACPPALAPVAALQALFPATVAVAFSDPRSVHAPPRAVEISAIARAVPARRAEFAAGRAAIRAAMTDLGVPAAAVPVGADRAPVWPEGLTGSLAHCSTLCIAALALSEKFCAIGTDLEEARDLDPALIPDICTLAERAWLTCQPAKQRGLLATLIFSAKECAYKCQYALSGTLIDFATLEITPDLDTGQFEATFTRAVAPFSAGACLSGRFVIEAGLIGCGMALPRRPRWGPG